MKPLAPKTTLQNRYQITELIGKGGMGEVYLAIDQRLGHSIALKRTTVGDDLMLTEAFEREARTLAQLRHSTLPKVSDHFIENDEQFLVMEYISGEDLSQRLKSTDKPFPLNWVMFWADQLLEVLTYLHTYDPPIIHRDIKPQNLKLTDSNQIVLLDFGLSKNTLGHNQVTTSGSVVGYTPHYASMEQIRGTGTNARSDIFSLSATLYHLLSNTVPSDALTRADALLSGMPDPLIPLTKFNPEITQKISDEILKGMEISQDKRFESAREMQKALRKAFNEMQKSMSAQTEAFNLEDVGYNNDDVVRSDAKTEMISGLPLISTETSTPIVSNEIPNTESVGQGNSNLSSIENASTGDFSADKTEVINVADLENIEDVSIADATVQFNGDIIDSPIGNNSGIPTEAISGEDLHQNVTLDDFPTKEEIPAAIPIESEYKTKEDFSPTDSHYKTKEDFSPTENYYKTSEDLSPEEFKTNEDISDTGDNSPDATVPLITYDVGIVENKNETENLEVSDWNEGFESEVIPANEIEQGDTSPATSNFGLTEDFSVDNRVDNTENFVAEAVENEDSQSKSKAATANSFVAQESAIKDSPKKQKSSAGKYVAILGGLGAILVILMGTGLAVGWYYTNGGFGSGDDNSTTTNPTPEITPEVAPSVESNPATVETTDTPETTVENPNSTESTEETTTTTEENSETSEPTDSTTVKSKDPKTTNTTKNKTSTTKNPTVNTTKKPKVNTNKPAVKPTKPPTPKPKKKVKNPGVI